MYKGHEIAVHTLTHQDLTKLDKDTVYNEVFLDKQNLERMFGCQITGMAYPYGTYNDEVVQILKKCKIQYARSVVSSGAFKLQKNLLIFKPTCHHADENIWELLEKFLKEKSEEKQLFYIWGHSYELEDNSDWGMMEELLKRICGLDDVWYASNIDIMDYIKALSALKFGTDSKTVYNPSCVTVWIEADGEAVKIEPGYNRI